MLKLFHILTFHTIQDNLTSAEKIPGHQPFFSHLSAVSIKYNQKGLFSGSWSCSQASLSSLLSNTTKTVWGYYPAPFNITYKKHMSARGWQLSQASHYVASIACVFELGQQSCRGLVIMNGLAAGWRQNTAASNFAVQIIERWNIWY